MIQTHGGDVYRYPDMLDFSANINPLGTPSVVMEAAAASLKNIKNYPDLKKQELFEALSEAEQMPVENLILGNGAAELIFAFCWAVKPKNALLTAPSFAEYERGLKACGCQKIRYAALLEEAGFRMEEAFLSELTEDLDVVMLCNPNNPTGCLIDGNLLEKILQRCREYHIYLLLDECFVDFVDEPEKTTCKQLLEQYREMFILKAFTKLYAMAGLRLGYGMSRNTELLQKMEQCLQPWNISIPAQAAGVAALREKAYVAESRQLIRQERKWLQEQLKALGIRVYDSAANYIFFRGPEGLTEKLLKQQIMIRDCSGYPGLGEGYYRIAVRTHAENEKLIQIMTVINI